MSGHISPGCCLAVKGHASLRVIVSVWFVFRARHDTTGTSLDARKSACAPSSVPSGPRCLSRTYVKTAHEAGRVEEGVHYAQGTVGVEGGLVLGQRASALSK